MFNKREYQKKYALKHKKHKKEYDDKYRQTHKEKIKKYIQTHKKQIQERHRKYLSSVEGKYSYYQTNAKNKGFIFNITFNEFSKLLNEPCYYCGGEGHGVDRLDSSIGYLKDNIVSCCSMCNFMKRTYTEDEFIEKCIKIANYVQNVKEVI